MHVKHFTSGIWRRGATALILWCLALPFLAQDQPAPFTVKVSTRLVVQAVSVTDKDGKAVEGLTAEDFTLTEDNVPQTISVFEFQKLEDTALPALTARPAPVFAEALQPANTRITPVPDGDARYQDRRLLALYFDLSAMDAIERFRALTSAQTFIEKEMQGPDMVALFTYSNGAVRVRLDFTSDRAGLQEAILRLLYPKEADALEDMSTDFGRTAANSTSSTPIASSRRCRRPSTCSVSLKRGNRLSTSPAA